MGQDDPFLITHQEGCKTIVKSNNESMLADPEAGLYNIGDFAVHCGRTHLLCTVKRENV